MAFTTISNIINPEVLRDQIAAKFPDMLVFGSTDLVQVDSDVSLPTPGTQVKMPFWKRIGAFGDLTENTAMTPTNITADAEYAVVVRGGSALEILDTAELVSKADPVGEVANQLARRAAEYIDGKLVTAIKNTPNLFDQSIGAAKTNTNGTVDQNAIVLAMLTLGDNMAKLQSGGKIIMHSKVYGDLLQLAAIQNNYQSNMDVLKTGMVGTILGLPIIVSDLGTTTTQSSKTLYNTYIVAPGALGLLYQREVMVEFDRDILLSADVIATTVHFAPHLYGWDESTATAGVGGSQKAEQAKSISAVRLTSY